MKTTELKKGYPCMAYTIVSMFATCWVFGYYVDEKTIIYYTGQDNNMGIHYDCKEILSLEDFNKRMSKEILMESLVNNTVKYFAEDTNTTTINEPFTVK